MTIPFDCPHCGGHTDVAEDYAGQTGPCAHCGKAVTVPPLTGTPGYTTPTKGTPGLLVVLLIVVAMGLLLFFCGGLSFFAFQSAPMPMPPTAVGPTPLRPPTAVTTPVPAITTAQVAFAGPEGMRVDWPGPSGPDTVDVGTLVAPGRFVFPQEATFGLVLTSIPGYPGAEFAGSLEVGPSEPGAELFLNGNAIPIEFTDEDFDQVLAGNQVTKVYYLPNGNFQGLADGGVEVLLSTGPDPDVDPLAEAKRRGIILLVVKLGEEPEEAAAEPE